MREHNLYAQVYSDAWTCLEDTPVRIEKTTEDGQPVVVWEGDASDLGAEIERLRDLENAVQRYVTLRTRPVDWATSEAEWQKVVARATQLAATNTEGESDE